MSEFFERKKDNQEPSRLERDDLLQIQGVLQLAQVLENGLSPLWGEVYSRLSGKEREALGVNNRGSQDVSGVKDALFAIRLILKSYERGVEGDSFVTD